MPHRCAFGCVNTDVVMHVFPNPDKFPERFKAWMDLLGGKLEIPLNEFLRKKRICDIHFISEHRNRNKRLNALAIPLLHLPGISKSQESENSGDSQPSISFAAADIIASGVSIHQDPEKRGDIQPNTSTAAAAFIVPGASMIQKPETRCDTQPGSSILASDLRHHNVTAATVLKEHNYSVLSTPKQTPLVEGAPKRTTFYKCGLIKPMQTKLNICEMKYAVYAKKVSPLSNDWLMQ